MPEQRSSFVIIDEQEEIRERLVAERARLRREAGLSAPRHFQKPKERAFGAEERDRVTILFGGLTWKHEELIKAVFHGNNYKCEMVPTPNVGPFSLVKSTGITGSAIPLTSPSAT